MRSKVAERIRNKPIVKKETKEERPSLAFQLGYFVGDKLMAKHIPTLSVDMIKSGKIIQVTVGEGDKYRKLNEEWFKEKDESKRLTLFAQFRDMWSALADKYLPKTLECHINPIYIEDKDLLDFKEGIKCSLWNSDCCPYEADIDKIEVSHDEYFTTIKLVRA